MCIRDSGLLVCSGDHIALAEGIICLLNNQKQALTFCDNAYQRVKTIFSINCQISSYTQLYASLILTNKNIQQLRRKLW